MREGTKTSTRQRSYCAKYFPYSATVLDEIRAFSEANDVRILKLVPIYHAKKGRHD